MPLRDHFHPPLSTRLSWQGFHASWPTFVVQRLMPKLPDGFIAEPRAQLGKLYEIDIGAFEGDESDGPVALTPPESGGVATLAYTAPHPTWTTEVESPEQYAYEVLVYELGTDRELVAAVEFVSPANKDRPDSRRAFVAKCANLLANGACVAIVDVVTTRRANLYAELLEFLDRADPAFGPDPPGLYAASFRIRSAGPKSWLESWAYPLALGSPLPTLPLHLRDELAVGLDLDGSYGDTCRLFRVP
jgi:hypothetical protein